MTQKMRVLYSGTLSDYLLAQRFACITMHICFRWRTAFYVAGESGCVANFFILLDEFLTWKMKAIQKEVEAGLWSRHLFVVVGVAVVCFSGAYLPGRAERDQRGSY